jgi:ribosomal protein S18 acetylase RimI-like enzyme
MNIRPGTVEELVRLALQIPEFADPYKLASNGGVVTQDLDCILIAEVAGARAGFRASYKYSADTCAVWLSGVLTAYRGRGIYTALYCHQDSLLKSQGVRYLRTHVRNSNRRMMKILIEKGFDIIEVLPEETVGLNKIVFLKQL